MALLPLPMRGFLASSFRVGDKVVYPNHGVGIIEQIALRSNGFTTERYYLLSIRSSALKVTVPCQNATAVGLRGLVCKDEMDRILIFLAQAGGSNNADWKERYREHMDKMKAGTLMEVAEVLKSLLVLHQQKELSVRERKTMERARYLLVNEMAQAKQCDELSVEDMVLAALLKADLRFPDVIGDEGAA
jgi:CarD family transcriptional regulator